MLDHGALQLLEMSRAAVLVDLAAVGSVAEHVDSCACTLEGPGTGLEGSAVRAIDDDAQSVKGNVEGREKVIDVAVDRVVVGGDRANLCAERPRPLFVKARFDRIFDLVGEFHSAAREEFDAVIGVRVVARGDHDAKIGFGLFHEVGEARSGQYACIEHVNASGSETCTDRRGNEVARGARIVGDDCAGLRPALAAFTRFECAELPEDVGCCDGKFDRELRGDVFVRHSANAVGSKQTCHVVSSFIRVHEACTKTLRV